jgi:hypothetical protein
MAGRSHDSARRGDRRFLIVQAALIAPASPAAILLASLAISHAISALKSNAEPSQEI